MFMRNIKIELILSTFSGNTGKSLKGGDVKSVRNSVSLGIVSTHPQSFATDPLLLHVSRRSRALTSTWPTTTIRRMEDR
jgi:hypothetical protein